VDGTTYGEAGALAKDASQVCAPPPVGWKARELAVKSDLLIPFFGKESSSRSQWIALGLARVDPDGGTDQVRFRFEGTDVDGVLERDGNQQVVLPPIIGPSVLAVAPALPHVSPTDSLVMVLNAAGLVGDNDAYKRNPALLREFVLRLEDSASSSHALEFQVAFAVYDAARDVLSVTVFPAGQNDLTDLEPAGSTLVSLIPFFTRVTTAGSPLQYPSDSAVTITFEATTADSEGNPNEGVTTGEVGDITDLNLDDFDFFRFRVRMNLSVSGQSVNQLTPRPGLEFLRVPFRF
jgi:hypothetical protein